MIAFVVKFQKGMDLLRPTQEWAPEHKRQLKSSSATTNANDIQFSLGKYKLGNPEFEYNGRAVKDLSSNGHYNQSFEHEKETTKGTKDDIELQNGCQVNKGFEKD